MLLRKIIMPTILILLFLYSVWGQVAYRIVENVDYPEIRWNIIENDSDNIKGKLEDLGVMILKEEKEYYAYGKKITLSLDNSFPSADENVIKIKGILRQIGYENIQIEDEYRAQSGSFAIRGKNGRKEVVVFCSSKQGIDEILVKINYTKIEVLEWTIQKYLFE